MTHRPADWPITQVHGDTLVPLTVTRLVVDGEVATVETAWAEVRTVRGTSGRTVLAVAADTDGTAVTFFAGEEITWDPGTEPFKAYWAGRVEISAPIVATITILEGVFEIRPRVVQP